ncbi:MAG: flagellar M-ring protein FliF [Gammaproteobacteria bacterium]|nr:flagellar M-ring protein FliF [Gammaproteobacteria bacterium]
MAEALPLPLGKPLAAFTSLPMQRQFALLIGLAMVVAVGAMLALWGMRPTYEPLLPGMSERDVVQAMDVLTRLGIEHELDSATGMLTVPAKRTHEARLHLATEGIPRADGVGFELLDQDTGIGTSRAAQAVRFQRALEGELARSIVTLDSVEAARVHLALPRESVFVRDRAKPGASVLLNLHPARTLDERQIAGIVHLIASSVPELAPERVTVVDQRGRLLSSPEDGGDGMAPTRQLEYTREVEAALRQRVERILSPLVGEEGVRVQVTADVDFTRVESTRETYDPDATVLRSEQVSEERRSDGAAGGVPGALTNQPPDGAAVAVAAPATGEAAATATPTSSSRRSTRNYEVDRTISHVREAAADLERLSVAVVVDHRSVVGEDGQIQRVPRDADEMQYLTSLVREAVGFDEARGDRVNVVNASFREIEAPEPLPAPALWQEPWARDLIRQAGAGLGILLLVLLVLRPAVKSLTSLPLHTASTAVLAPPSGSSSAAAAARDGTSPAEERPGPLTLEGSLENARRMTQEDPRLVAQVVRQWVHADEK